MQHPDRLSPVVFLPSHLASVGIEVLAADGVVLPDLRAVEAGEVGLGLIGGSAVQPLSDGVVDAMHLVASVQPIPGSGFAGGGGFT